MVAVPAVLEMAGPCPVAVLTVAVVLAVAAGIGVDVALPDLLGDLPEQPVQIVPQPPQLSRRGNAAGKTPVPAHPHRQIVGLRQGLMFHGLEYLRLRQNQAAAAQFLLPPPGQLLRRDAALRGQNLIPGRQVQHAGRFHRTVEVGLSLLLQSEEIEQHLDIQAHLHRREVEGLPAGLVVHHPEVQFAVPDPAVHPVHLTAQAQLAVGLREHH